MSAELIQVNDARNTGIDQLNTYPDSVSLPQCFAAVFDAQAAPSHEFEPSEGKPDGRRPSSRDCGSLPLEFPGCVQHAH